MKTAGIILALVALVAVLSWQPGEYITDKVWRDNMTALLLGSSKYYPDGNTAGIDVRVAGIEVPFDVCCDTVDYAWLNFDSLYVAPFVQVIRPSATANERPHAVVEEYTNTWARISLSEGTGVLLGGNTAVNSAHADTRLSIILIGNR